MKSETPSSEEKIDTLIRSLDKIYPSYKELMYRSFLQGIFIGLGTTIGVSIILGLLTFVISQLQIIPELNGIIESYQIQQLLKSGQQ